MSEIEIAQKNQLDAINSFFENEAGVTESTTSSGKTTSIYGNTGVSNGAIMAVWIIIFFTAICSIGLCIWGVSTNCGKK